MFTKTNPIRFILVLSFLTILLVSACLPLDLVVVEKIVTFDPAENQLPEGIALEVVVKV